jgi:hypothetical protein
MRRGQRPEPRPSRLRSLPAPLRGLGGLALLVLAAAVIAFAALTLTGALDDDEVTPDRIFSAAVEGGSEDDPFAWDRGRRDEFEEAAALGYSHPLYTVSPGGAPATARRTARFREAIEDAADEHSVSAEMMEAMVFLESAGRPEVIAGGTDAANASGLAQILASTGIDLLGMDIDLGRSQQLTDEITDSLQRAERLRRRGARLAERADGRRQERRARRLLSRAREAEASATEARRERRRIDPRFDSEAALDAMGRYLAIAGERFGREDLAVTSYHMGIGNLGDVIEAYVDPGETAPSVRELVDEDDLSYAQLFFDSSPLENPEPWRILSGFGDESSTYYWRVLAALEIMELYRDDRDELRRLAALHGNKATAEEVFHPEDETPVFEDADALADGIEGGELVTIPPGREYGYRVGRQLGELADELEVDRELYRALRPEALATLIYMAGRVQAITDAGGGRGPTGRLTVTSAVRDRAYQGELAGRNGEATSRYSLHTTGYAFDVLRDYASDRQAQAFQFVLDRMRALGVIDYAVEPAAIHITVSERASELLD